MRRQSTVFLFAVVAIGVVVYLFNSHERWLWVQPAATQLIPADTVSDGAQESPSAIKTSQFVESQKSEIREVLVVDAKTKIGIEGARLQKVKSALEWSEESMCWMTNGRGIASLSENGPFHVTATGYAAKYIGNNKNLSTGTLQVELVGSARICGLVRDPWGSPIPRLKIRVSTGRYVCERTSRQSAAAARPNETCPVDDGRLADVETDESGQFIVDGVYPGMICVQLFDPNLIIVGPKLGFYEVPSGASSIELTAAEIYACAIVSDRPYFASPQGLVIPKNEGGAAQYFQLGPSIATNPKTNLTAARYLSKRQEVLNAVRQCLAPDTLGIPEVLLLAPTGSNQKVRGSSDVELLCVNPGSRDGQPLSARVFRVRDLDQLSPEHVSQFTPARDGRDQVVTLRFRSADGTCPIRPPTVSIVKGKGRGPKLGPNVESVYRAEPGVVRFRCGQGVFTVSPVLNKASDDGWVFRPTELTVGNEAVSLELLLDVKVRFVDVSANDQHGRTIESFWVETEDVQRFYAENGIVRFPLGSDSNHYFVGVSGVGAHLEERRIEIRHKFTGDGGCAQRCVFELPD